MSSAAFPFAVSWRILARANNESMDTVPPGVTFFRIFLWDKVDLVGRLLSLGIDLFTFPSRLSVCIWSVRWVTYLSYYLHPIVFFSGLRPSLLWGVFLTTWKSWKHWNSCEVPEAVERRKSSRHFLEISMSPNSTWTWPGIFDAHSFIEHDGHLFFFGHVSWRDWIM